MQRKTLVILVLLACASAVLALDKTPSEAYSGVAIGTGGGGSKSLQFDFRITQYATDEEVRKFAQVLNENGVDALRRSLEKEDKGSINLVGSSGDQIAVARKRQDGPETIITVVTAHTLPFLGLYNRGRSDYPFGYLQVKIDAKGVGTGQIMAAAKIRFDMKRGTYEIGSFGNQHLKVTMFAP